MQHEHYTHTAPESSSDTAFAAYQYAAPLLSDLHAEITAIISTLFSPTDFAAFFISSSSAMGMTNTK
jgi:hypothetical protein